MFYFSPKLLEQLKQDTRTMEVKLTKEAAQNLGDDKISLDEKDFRFFVRFSCYQNHGYLVS